jgi:hypothetical protein
MSLSVYHKQAQGYEMGESSLVCQCRKFGETCRQFYNAEVYSKNAAEIIFSLISV